MSETKRARGGALLARALHEKGVDQVFTLSGGFCNPALEGFMELQMPVVNCPHEQVAGHLADGWTRLTRRPAVCLVGPEGFANAVPAMMEAWGERSPVLFVTGSSTLNRQGAGGFKEIDDVAIAAPLTKYSAQITSGARIGEFVDRAWRIATSGYPGPVHLSLPVDIMFSSFDAEAGREERPFDRGPPEPPRAWPEPRALARITDALAAARRPLLIAGHGVWWSRAEQALSEAGRELGIPIFNVPYHRKLLDEDCPAWIGLADVHQLPPSRDALEECDLALMVGGRLDNQLNFGNPPLFPASARLVCVNGSHEELTLNRGADDLLLCDPGAFLAAILESRRAGGWRLDPDWLGVNRARRGAWVEDTLRDLAADPGAAAGSGDKIHPLRLALDVLDCMAPEDWLVFDGGNTHFWSEIALNISGWRGHRLAGVLHPGSYSMLGSGVPLAMAARRARPEGAVVLISGDGAFLSGGLGIETAFQESAPIVVVIDNNQGLDCISQQQERLFASGAHFATDFRDIPFHGMFSGLGGHGELVENPAELGPALRRAIESGRPACVNVRTKGVISPIVLATTNKRDKASIE